MCIFYLVILNLRIRKVLGLIQVAEKFFGAHFSKGVKHGCPCDHLEWIRRFGGECVQLLHQPPQRGLVHSFPGFPGDHHHLQPEGAYAAFAVDRVGSLRRPCDFQPGDVPHARVRERSRRWHDHLGRRPHHAGCRHRLEKPQGDEDRLGFVGRRVRCCSLHLLSPEPRLVVDRLGQHAADFCRQHLHRLRPGQLAPLRVRLGCFSDESRIPRRTRLTPSRVFIYLRLILPIARKVCISNKDFGNRLDRTLNL